MTGSGLDGHWEFESPVVPREEGDLTEWIASCNLGSQEQFFVSLAVAQSESGVTSGVVAERLGITSDEVDDILHGRTDLTFTELRLFSLAAEVVVSYRVTSARREWTRMHAAFDRMTAVHRGFVTSRYDAPEKSHSIDPLEVARKALAAR